MNTYITLPDGSIAEINLKKIGATKNNSLNEKQFTLDCQQFREMFTARNQTPVKALPHSEYDYTDQKQNLNSRIEAPDYRKITLRSHSYFDYKGTTYLAKVDKNIITNESFMAAMNTVPIGYTIAIDGAGRDVKSILVEELHYNIYNRDGSLINSKLTNLYHPSDIKKLPPLYLTLRVFIY